jgi:hypothetical protein
MDDWVKLKGYPRVFFDAELFDRLSGAFDEVEIFSLGEYIDRNCGKFANLQAYFPDLKTSTYPLKGVSSKRCTTRLLIHYNKHSGLKFVIEEVTDCKPFDASLVKKVKSILKRITEYIGEVEMDG